MTPAVLPAYLEAGEGPPLVFLHGIGGAARSFRRQLDGFAARGWRALAWDMPGYGDSPAVTPSGFDAWADALAAMLAAADARSPVLVGHSIGGMIVQAYLARHRAGPYAARAAVLSGTSPAFGKPDGDFQRRFVADRVGPLDRGLTMADLAPDLVAGMVAPGADPDGLALAQDCMAAIPAATYRDNMAVIVTFEMRAQLPEIAVPTLCLAGEKDGNAPPVVLEKMAAKIPGAVYACLPDVGHLPYLEAPAQFDAALTAFLDTLPPAVDTDLPAAADTDTHRR